MQIRKRASAGICGTDLMGLPELQAIITESCRIVCTTA